MAKSYVSSEVLKNVQGIVSDKGSYELDKASGGTDYEKIHTAAQPKYDYLDQYAPDLANQLRNSDYETSKNILSNLAVSPLETKNNTVSNANKEKAIATQWVAAKKQFDELDSKGWDTSEVRALGQKLKAQMAELNPELAETLSQLGYAGANELVNSYNWQTTPLETATNNNTLLAKNAQTGFDNINTMYFDPEYGQEIRDYFKAYGKSEGNQVAASAAADNGGNFDSFAQYNKDNTQLAYNVAAENAIQAKRLGYTDGYTNFFNTVQNGINTSSANLLNYDYGMENIAAQERMNSANNLVTMYGYDKELEANNYTVDGNVKIAGINADATKHVSDNELAASNYATDGSVKIAGINNNNSGSDSDDGGFDLTGLSEEDAAVFKMLYERGVTTKEAAKAALINDGYDEADADAMAADYITRYNSGGVVVTGETSPETDTIYKDKTTQEIYDELEKLRSGWKSSDLLDNEWYTYLGILENYIVSSDIRPTAEQIKEHMADNFMKYTIDREKATELCNAIGLDTSWLGGYEDVGENVWGVFGEWGNTYLKKIDDTDTTPNTKEKTDTTPNTKEKTDTTPINPQILAKHPDFLGNYIINR